jgi:eukaryotic-like serine/threonine-protein kinase
VVLDCPKCGGLVPVGPGSGRHRPRCPRCRVVVPDHEPAVALAVAEPGLARETSVCNVLVTPNTFVPLTPIPRSRRNASKIAAGSTPEPHNPPAAWPTLPGYSFEAVLGTGGMGTVYKARQLSLDRPVALKVMSSKWSADPVFVARFTREAFAAAQLNHPNIVQIYDIGSAGAVRYFSMEYVAGRTLSEEVKLNGRMPPAVAAGYVLQAARGLLHAHERGMIHRDVKPDNLLLDAQGVIKVADLGLVKTPDLTAAQDTLDVTTDSGLYTLPPDMTGVKIALGTPAYMSPEQCRDAAGVDHRADVYSLGATLYALVTGKPPFDGTSAVGLMTKQAYEPPVPPEKIAPAVPRELSAVILTMMAKDPADRYQTMAGVIGALEGWLGLRRAGGVTPQDTAGEDLDAAARRFRSAPAAVLRHRVFGGFGAGCAVAAAGLATYGSLGWAFGAAALLVQAALAYFVLAGLTRRSYLFSRVRQYLCGLTWGDRVAVAAGVGLLALILSGLGLLNLAIGFGLIGAGLAVAARLWLDRAVDRERRPVLATARETLRRVRLDGVAEDDLRLFTARAAGPRWEEFFEALFGYEAKLVVRAELARGGRAAAGVRFAPWRDPILVVIDRAEQARKDRREQVVLNDAERDRLMANGLTPVTAAARAKRSAEAMVKRASRLRLLEKTAGPDPAMSQQLFRAAENPDAEPDPPDHLGTLFAFLVGPVVRGLLAFVLAGLCGYWVVQNNGFVAELGARTNQPVSADETADLPSTAPFAVPGFDARYTARVAGVNVAAAALLLLVSLFHRGPRMGVLVLAGAAVAAAGPAIGPPAFPPLHDAHLALLLGIFLALVGYRCGPSKV